MSSSSPATSVKVIGFCNPLLDISAEVPLSFLEKYKLKQNNAILAEDHHLPLYGELQSNFQCHYVAGGSGLNAMRVGQWISRTPNTFGYFGCIGQDKNANILLDGCKQDGVTVNFDVDPVHPTGTCAALIHNHQRSLVANLSAANHYRYDHFRSPSSQAMLESASILYATSFFLTVSPETVMEVAKHAAEKGKIFVMNLSAPFLMEVPIFRERVLACIPYMDYVFGNHLEAAALAAAYGWKETSLEKLAQLTAELPKLSTKRKRTVIFTHGPNPAVVYADGKVSHHPVIPLKPEQLVDENGAGDAYLGGFLAGLIQNKSIEESIFLGSYAAYMIIQQHGCAIPSRRPLVKHSGFSYGDPTQQ